MSQDFQLFMAILAVAVSVGMAFELGRAIGIMISNRLPAKWFGIDDGDGA